MNIGNKARKIFQDQNYTILLVSWEILIFPKTLIIDFKVQASK
jgi:hypothetical protein